MPTIHPRENNPYVIDPEAGAEMARLTHQDRLLTKGMGGFFPELSETEIDGLHEILDIGCGPGGWVLDVARTWPEKQVRGIDISKGMVDYARATAWSQRLEDNAYFEVMDATKPLEFPDNAFDLVNARLIMGFMSPATWPFLLQECLRITRPGGRIRLTEADTPISNSLAYERMNAMVTRALHVAGRSFSPDGRHYGTIYMLEPLLRQAGFQHLQKCAHVIDYSAGAEMARSNYENNMVFFKLIQPFLIQMKVTTQEEVDAVYEQMLSQMQQDDFYALWFLLTVGGIKL